MTFETKALIEIISVIIGVFVLFSLPIIMMGIGI